MTDERAEAEPRRVTPWHRAILQARRLHLARLVIVAVVATLLGLGIGRWTAPEVHPDVRTSVERTVQPLALEADAIWTSSVVDDRPPVAEGIGMVRRGENVTAVGVWAEDWLEAYDTLLIQLTGLDLSSDARPVQRHFVNAVTLSRDAVDVLHQATEIDDASARQALVGEALRLRQRAEHMTQTARAAVRDLEGGEGEVSRHPDLPRISEAEEPG